MNDEYKDTDKGELDLPDHHNCSNNDEEGRVKGRNTSHDRGLGHLDEP